MLKRKKTSDLVQCDSVVFMPVPSVGSQSLLAFVALKKYSSLEEKRKQMFWKMSD